MDIFIRTTLLLTISCCLCTTEGRQIKSVLTVPNGGPWGEWGKAELCQNGFVYGFKLKVIRDEIGVDNTGLDGIGLLCTDSSILKSSYSRWGNWKKRRTCPAGHYLVAFSLRVQPFQGKGDDTAANNIHFKCSDGSTLMGYGNHWGEFSPWSPFCPTKSYICGIQTKLEPYQWMGDDTSLNDVKFFCCQ